jgi:hypothetical protein
MRVPRSYHVRMQPSPVQAAEHEQAQRQAAFQRARAKLAAARAEHAVRPEQRRALWGAIAILVSVLYFVAVGAYVWWRPEALSPSSWAHDITVPATLIAVPMAVALLVLVRWVGGRRHPADDLVRSFYMCAGAAPTALKRFVISQDLGDYPRRECSPHPAFSPPGMLDSEQALTNYWKSMLRMADGTRLGLHVKSVRLTPISHDLLLAQTRLQVTRARPVKAFLYVMASIVAYGAAQWVLMGTLLEKPLFLLWMVVVFLILACVNSSLRTPVTARKLVVHNGGEWRLLCGDWEGWEEADLSWLDEQEPRA